MSPTPCPGNPGCRCPYCHGLHEYMAELTGNTHGLPRTYRPFVVEQPQLPEPIQFRPRRVRQPWEARPARNRAA